MPEQTESRLNAVCVNGALKTCNVRPIFPAETPPDKVDILIKNLDRSVEGKGAVTIS